MLGRFGRPVAVLVAAMVLGGCAADSASQAGPTAECAVCRENGDLACLHVRVRDDTPRAEVGGKTYYFCSEECREEFLRHPEKYAAK